MEFKVVFNKEKEIQGSLSQVEIDDLLGGSDSDPKYYKAKDDHKLKKILDKIGIREIFIVSEYTDLKLIDYSLLSQISVSEIEKKELYRLIEKLVSISELRNRAGLSELEKKIDDIDEEFARTIIQLVVDEMDYETIKHFGLTYIYINKLNNYTLLEHLIILQGSLLTQKKTNPRIVNQILRSYIPLSRY
jgi:hypothetical protein